MMIGSFATSAAGAAPDALRELEARHPGHQAVGDDEVRDEPVLQEAQRLLPVLGLGHVVTQAGEFRDHYAPHDAVVVCHQNLRAARIQELIASLSASVHITDLRHRVGIVGPKTKGIVTCRRA